jgi:trimeric autotransporter adhesin
MSNTTGHDNTASGANALSSNTEGYSNVAIGSGALASNLGAGNTGFQNTAVGDFAMSDNTEGWQNTAVGWQALQSNTTGIVNTAVGHNALGANTTGSQNIGLGEGAGFNVHTASNVICIGTGGQDVGDSCYINNIWLEPGGSQAVYVNDLGKLGAVVSSRRFKDEIKPMEQTSEVIYQLKPVSFRYKREIESTGPPSFGLIAEDVDTVNPDLVLHDKKGKPYTVRYDAVNAMLLNEFLEEHRKVQEQQATIAQLKKTIDTVLARLNEQDSKIQNVSQRAGLSESLPRLVSSKER